MRAVGFQEVLHVGGVIPVVVEAGEEFFGGERLLHLYWFCARDDKSDTACPKVCL